MNKKRIAQLCCAALVASGIGLNIQNAIADYGIGENSLSLVAGPGSNSGSNSNSNTGSGPGDYFVRKYHECGKQIEGVKNSLFYYTISGYINNQSARFDKYGRCYVSIIRPNTIYCDSGGKNACTPNPCPTISWHY